MLSGDVLYYQIPDTLTATGYRCQLDSVFPMQADVVDDVTPSVVAWFCNWGGFANWASVPNIHFLVYEDSSGQPVDSPMTEIVVEQSDYTTYYINGPDPNRWRVEMELPITVMLDTVRYWIEIQPSNSTMDNGNTGHQAQVGIGNGQDFYMRFPLAGTPSWESATSLFGEVLETGFILIGDELGVSDKTLSKSINKYEFGATVINGPLDIPEGSKYKVYDIMGRITAPDKMKPGVYFIKIDNIITSKIIKIR
jgi:hypothetical protein